MRIYFIAVIAIFSTVACPMPTDSTKKAKVEETEPNTPKTPIIQQPSPNTGSPAKMVGPLSGEINGEKWSFVAGKANKVGNKLKIVLYDQPVEGCGEPADLRAPSILLPDQNLTPGKGDFSHKIMAGFKYRTDKPQNDFAVEGKWQISEVGPTSVSGGMAVEYRNHKMNGTFTVPLCQ